MVTPRRFDRARFSARPARAQRRVATVLSLALFVATLLGAAASSRSDRSTTDPEQANRPAAARVVLVGSTTTSTVPPDTPSDAPVVDPAPEDASFGNSSDSAADR